MNFELETSVANWTRRRQLIGFCVDVVDQSLAEADGDQNPALRAKVRKYVIDSDTSSHFCSVDIFIVNSLSRTLSVDARLQVSDLWLSPSVYLHNWLLDCMQRSVHGVSTLCLL